MLPSSGRFRSSVAALGADFVDREWLDQFGCFINKGCCWTFNALRYLHSSSSTLDVQGRSHCRAPDTTAESLPGGPRVRITLITPFHLFRVSLPRARTRPPSRAVERGHRVMVNRTMLSNLVLEQDFWTDLRAIYYASVPIPSNILAVPRADLRYAEAQLIDLPRIRTTYRYCCARGCYATSGTWLASDWALHRPHVL